MECFYWSVRTVLEKGQAVVQTGNSLITGVWEVQRLALTHRKQVKTSGRTDLSGERDLLSHVVRVAVQSVLVPESRDHDTLMIQCVANCLIKSGNFLI